MALTKYYTDLFKAENEQPAPIQSNPEQIRLRLENAVDPFKCLPAELLVQILSYVPTKSILPLQLASPVMRYTGFTLDFWRDRFAQDLPWFWDLPIGFNGSAFTADDRAKASRVDWAKTYCELKEASYLSGVQPRDRNLRLGISNRRRIWNVCRQLVEPYLGIQKWEKELQRLNSERQFSSLDDEAWASQPLSVYAPPASQCRELLQFCLIDNMEQLDDLSGAAFHVYWNEDGSLRGFGATFDGDTRVCGLQNDHRGRSDTLALDDLDTWIAALELTMSTLDIYPEGDESQSEVTGVKVC